MPDSRSLSPVAHRKSGWVGILFDENEETPFWMCEHLHPDLDSAEECANAHLEDLLKSKKDTT